MQKKVLALVAMLALLIGVFAVGASADTNSGRYRVGYAIKDINPYIYSDNLEMGVKGLGDLAYDETLTVEVPIYNPATGATTRERMIKVPLSGYANSKERPSTNIMDDNGDGYTGIGDGLHVTCTSVTDADNTTVMFFTVDAISGFDDVVNDLRGALVKALGSQGVVAERIMLTGSHSHSAADLYTCRSDYGNNVIWKKYYDYALSQLVAAGKEAFASRTEAVMTKGEIDAYESSGYQLNFVRHYNVVEQKKINGSWTTTDTYVAGSNFGGPKEPTSTSTQRIQAEPVSEANDMMYLLQFAPTNGDAPIVLVNWRAHATLSSTSNTDPIISSDYINSLRYQLQKNGYRAAFIQSAAGNINPTHVVMNTIHTPWRGASVSSSELPSSAMVNKYGYLLSQVALACLRNPNQMTEELEPGKIHTKQTKFEAYAQVDSPGLRAAADYWKTNGQPATFPYNYNGYILNSSYHANKILGRLSNTDTTTKTFELNAIALGSQFAMVTSPCEMFDRYSSVATMDNINEYNDWENLNNKIYGTPWLLGYTNAHQAYIPYALAYTYNEGHSTYGVGSYEANTSLVAKGEGERFLAEYKEMLAEVANSTKTAYCQECKDVTPWQPLTKEDVSTEYDLSSGHYYLYEDVPLPSKANRGIINGANVCLDLNGKTLRTVGTAFRVGQEGTLSIFDSTDSNGCIESHTGLYAEAGGVISTYYNQNATINLYSGTLKYAGDNTVTSKGGVVSINATNTFNVYGGVVDASACTLVKDTGNQLSGDTDGCGAAIAVYSGGILNISGGRIIEGQAEPEEGRADCILVTDSDSKVTLSGNAQVDEIYFDKLCPTNFKISGAYTGTTSLAFNPSVELSLWLDIGNATDDADISNATLNFAGTNSWKLAVSGSDLVLGNDQNTTVATIGNAEYASLQAAVNAYSDTTAPIRLIENTGEKVTITKDTYLDLNGFDVTGKIEITAGTLYCMDSQTDDYTIEDENGYGKLKKVTGTVMGIPEESTIADDGYLMITEADGISFHRVNLDLTHMTLRAETEPSVYYKCNFMGDEKVSGAVTVYGVALSVQEMPDEMNLETMCKYSTYAISDGYEFKAGKDGNSANGTLLKGIMKSDNPYLINLRNSNMPIFGRAYIRTDSGYMFGGGRDLTLKTLTEKVDAKWNDIPDRHDALISMYKANIYIMQNWNLPNIIGKPNADTDGVLKILGIGNSYTMDCMWMLGKVYATENPGKNIQLGIAYISGGTLENHVDNIEGNSQVYTYYQLDGATDTWKSTENVTLGQIISANNWDMVSLQQGSSQSHTSSTYNEDIQTIQNYVVTTMDYKPTFFWNMTWAWPTGTLRPTHTPDAQMNMFYSIANAVKNKILPDKSFAFVMPVGVAVQNANTVLDDTDLYCDNTHINALARLMAAYVWYCQLENVDAQTLTALKINTTPAEFSAIHDNEVKGQVDHSEADLLIALEAVRNALITGRAGTFSLTNLTSAQ